MADCAYGCTGGCTKEISGVKFNRDDKKMEEGEKSDTKDFTDHELFSHLCFYNFAHMAAIPFIISG